MNSEDKLITTLLKRVVSGKHDGFCGQDLNESIDWSRFKELVSYHEIHPILYPVVLEYESLFPRSIITFLKENYIYNLIINKRLLDDFSSISEAFRQAKIAMVPLKGVAFLQSIYKHIPSRRMSDIDLLVDEIDLPHARLILLDLGFKERLEGLSKKYWLEKQCHIPFLKKNSNSDIIALDLHFGLDFKRGKREILPQLWSRVCDGMLSPEDTLFSLALHQRRFGKSLCLKNVVDAGLIVKNHQSSLDWDYVIEQAKSGRMCSSMFFLLEQVKYIFNSEICIPQLNILCPSRFKRKLASSFIKRNVFINFTTGKAKELYLKSHFILYDDFFEPVRYILNIPQEQFAKFYKLEPYSKRTDYLYRFRILYMLYKFGTNRSITNS